LNTTLCFDFGNTRLKCGVFRDGILEEVFTLTDDKDATLKKIIKGYQPSHSILSSVIDHNLKIESILEGTTHFHKVSVATHLPFTTPVGKPETIGADRLALIAGAIHFYHGRNNLVIGLGSCITYNFVNKYDSFIGGSISPGMEMRLKSLNTFTAKLPLIEVDTKNDGWDLILMGYDTRTNILSGVIFGMAAEIDGIISQYEEKYNNFNVILTGGDAPYFTHFLKHPVVAEPDLIFKGLYAISEANHTSFNFGVQNESKK
jgi:type III pantothenate kinase